MHRSTHACKHTCVYACTHTTRMHVHTCTCMRSHTVTKKKLLHAASPHSGELRTQKSSPSGENTDFKSSPFKAWSRSVYSHTCYTYCQWFLPCLFLTLPVHSPAFFPNLSRFFLCWLWLTHGSCVGPLNKIGHSAGGRFPCWVRAEYK